MAKGARRRPHQPQAAMPLEYGSGGVPDGCSNRFKKVRLELALHHLVEFDRHFFRGGLTEEPVGDVLFLDLHRHIHAALTVGREVLNDFSRIFVRSSDRLGASRDLFIGGRELSR